MSVLISWGYGDLTSPQFLDLFGPGERVPSVSQTLRDDLTKFCPPNTRFWLLSSVDSWYLIGFPDKVVLVFPENPRQTR